MSRNEQTWKLKGALTLARLNVKNARLLEGITSDETKTLEGWIIIYFGLRWWRHMKTKNIFKWIPALGAEL